MKADGILKKIRLKMGKDVKSQKEEFDPIVEKVARDFAIEGIEVPDSLKREVTEVLAGKKTMEELIQETIEKYKETDE